LFHFARSTISTPFLWESISSRNSSVRTQDQKIPCPYLLKQRYYCTGSDITTPIIQDAFIHIKTFNKW